MKGRYLSMLTLPLFLGIIISIVTCFANVPIVSLADKRSSGVLAATATSRLPQSTTPSLLSKLTFSWTKKLMEVGNKRTVQMDDIWLPEEANRMESISRVFDSYYTQEVLNSSQSTVAHKSQRSVEAFVQNPLSRAVAKMYRKELIFSGLLRLLNTAVQFLPSMIIARILRVVDKLSTTAVSTVLKKEGWILCASLFFSLCAKTIIENQYFYEVTRLGASIRGALSSAVYKKSLLLSPSGRQNATAGEIANLMQLDVGRLENVATTVHVLWDGILQVVGYTALLLAFLGPSVFAGIAVMIIVIPVQTIFFKKLSSLRSKMAKHTDSRVKLTNEVLQGIRAIKSYNWETFFKESLASLRDKELSILTQSANVRALLVSILSAAPSFVAVVTLAVYAYLGNDLTPAKVFTALALFNQLRFPLIFYPMVLNTMAEGRVSLDRLSKFFLRDEVQSYVTKDSSSTAAVTITNAALSWTKNMSDPRSQLKAIDIKINKGEMVAIIGPVGSGKSTLLNAILGELHLSEGKVSVNGRIGYVPQSSWIPNDILRNVITFGNAFDRRKYEAVIDSCCLSKDIAMLEFGDDTEIGEKGVNLSGGQKQRVSIARAMYEDVDIYLLDDPLSALDSDVGAQVFKKCFQQHLRGKTRILVTHQLSILREVDRVIVMDQLKDGKCCIKDQGTISELIRRGLDFSSIDNDGEESNNGNESPHAEIQQDSAVLQQEIILAGSEIEMEKLSSSSAPVVSSVIPQTILDPSSMTGSPKSKAESKVSGLGSFMTTEERAEGAVGFDVYKSYLDAGNKPWLIAITIMSFVLANFTQLYQQWIVAAWTSDPLYQKHTLRFYLSGVAVMASGVALFNYLRTFVGCLFGVSASKVMHLEMISRILRAPLGFFEATPIGRILQRFSKDLDLIDQQLPSSLGQLVDSGLKIISSILAILLVSPKFGFFLLPLSMLYIGITNYYRNVARELKRLESVSRSPIYSHFSETLGGLPVIRSFKRMSSFQVENERRVDDNLSVFDALKAIDRWLSVRLELLGNFVVLAAAALTITSSSRAGAAGISLNNALTVTSLLNWAVRNVADTESMMNSVERVLYISKNTRSEQPAINENFNSSVFVSTDSLSIRQQHLPSNDSELVQAGWPWQGGLMFSGVKLRYREDMDQVLKNLTLSIHPGERIGVVGRTGSGKSSIFRALLRLTEPDSGKIYLDGVDISVVGLDVLRSGVSIIPQDPVLFSASIRANLDPFSRLSDRELWNALKKVNLMETVSSLPGGLSFVVAEGGENFSSGQRQLICLARALVRRSKLLLLDEATSSIDYDTDILIQKTIRTEFKDCTVLTIAHRLSNILDSDRVLVMDSGEVAEFDTPQNLLKTPTSLLFRLFNSHIREVVKTYNNIESTGSDPKENNDVATEEPIDSGPRSLHITSSSELDVDLL